MSSQVGGRERQQLAINRVVVREDNVMELRPPVVA